MVMLPDALGMKEIVSATVIHSPKGFSSPDGRTTSYVSDREALRSLLDLLSSYPAKGGKFKDFPANTDHYRIFLHGKDNRVIALDIYASSLQSPLDGSFSDNPTDPNRDQIKKLLEVMMGTKK